MISIATVGTSMITRDFLDVLRQRDDARFIGTCSRDAGRAAAFTAEFGGTVPFTSVEELDASPEVDAVYLGSPNALHAEQALACIHAGKHVLVEKPFAANEREARLVFEAAGTAGVVALEAMRPLHDPAFRACAAAFNELGRIRRATLRFGKYSSRYDEILAGRRTNIFDCALASGGLMDMGVYSVEPLIELFGEPERIQAAGVLLDASTRWLTNGPIDGAGTILASYPGMVASLNWSKISADLAESQIEGERGTLTIDAISTPHRARVCLREEARRRSAKQVPGYSDNGTQTCELELPACDNTMCYELDDFLEAVRAVRDGAPAEEAPAGPYGTVGHFRDVTLASLRVMDEARRQMGVRFPADEQEE